MHTVTKRLQALKYFIVLQIMELETKYVREILMELILTANQP